MKFRTSICTGLLALFVLSPSAFAEVPKTPPPIDAQDMPRADRWIATIKDKLNQLEAFIALTDTSKILAANVGGINDLRRDMRQPHPNIDFRAHPDFPACDARLMKARTELARRGLYVGEWIEWTYDGQTVGEEETKYLDSFEDKFNSVRMASGVSDQNDEKLGKMQDILKRPEIETNPVLKIWRDNLAQHMMYGAIYRDALLRVRSIGSHFRSLKNDADKNWSGCKSECVKRVHRDAEGIVAQIDKVKAAGLDLRAHKVKLDENEPLSDEWDLVKMRAEALAYSKKN